MLFLEDQLAKAWATPFAPLATEKIQQFGIWDFKAKISKHIQVILHGISIPGEDKASTQILESISIQIASTSNSKANQRVHLIASTFAWKWKVAFSLLQQANTTTHLQSLAIKLDIYIYIYIYIFKAYPNFEIEPQIELDF